MKDKIIIEENFLGIVDRFTIRKGHYACIVTIEQLGNQVILGRDDLEKILKAFDELEGKNEQRENNETNKQN